MVLQLCHIFSVSNAGPVPVVDCVVMKFSRPETVASPLWMLVSGARDELARTERSYCEVLAGGDLIDRIRDLWAFKLACSEAREVRSCSAMVVSPPGSLERDTSSQSLRRN